MSIGFAVKFEGGKELENALNQLPKRMSKSALRSALRKAAKPVLVDAKRFVPLGEPTKHLRDALKILSTLKSSQRRGRLKGKGVEIFVGATFPSGAHAHLVEFGHELVGGKGGARRVVGRTRPHPFLRPAWDANKDKVLASLRVLIWAELAKQARKLAKKASAGQLTEREIEEIL
jgi:HK97 gp10 family phage protein